VLSTIDILVGAAVRDVGDNAGHDTQNMEWLDKWASTLFACLCEICSSGLFLLHLSYLGSYLLKTQMLGAFCLVYCAVALTMMFD